MQKLSQTKILMTRLTAIRLGVDAWNTGVKPSTLENCFEASEVKIHGLFPPPVDVDNIQEIEDDILDCIRVSHPSH